VEQDRQDPDRIARLPGCFAQRFWLSEGFDEVLLQFRVGEPGMTVPSQPPQVGSPDRVRLADEAEFPADLLARSSDNCALVPEVDVDSVGGATVGDDTLAIDIRQYRSGVCQTCRFPDAQVSANGCPLMPVTRASRSASMM
jgi:hypothetical protein